MPQQNDLSRSLISFDQTTTLVAVIELSQSSWLIAGTIPGIERQPLKKIAPDEAELLRVLNRWRDEAPPSPASPLPSRPDETGSGWHGG
jgi:transposase